jgi:hypothetical protein
MGHSNIIVAVLDSGTDWMHLDIGNGNDNYKNIDESSGWNFISNNNNVITTNGHGTRVAGIIGAKSNNSSGISGVSGGNNRSGVTIIPVCVGVNEPDAAILDDAIVYAVDNGAKIIQLSLGVGETNAINDAITYAIQNNVIIVCASGNDYNSSVNYPASHIDVMAVGATNQSNIRADFSNYGTDLDVVAPGVNILSTTLNNNYNSQDGTSFAAPIVSGIAALILSVRPDLTQTQVRQAIESTCTKLSGYSFSTNSNHPNGTWNNQAGHGLVNAYAALNSVAPSITGPSVLCAGSSGTFTVANPPSNFTWDKSSNLTLVSTFGNTATFSSNNSIVSGNAWVSVKTGNMETVKYDVHIGTQPAIFDIATYLPLNASCYEVQAFYVFKATAVSGNTPSLYQWSYRLSGTTPETVVNSTSEYGTFIFDTPGSYDVIVRSVSSCGVSVGSLSVKTVSVVDLCSGLFRIKAYPNPVESELNILTDMESVEVKSLKQTERVIYQLYDITLTNLVKQWVFDNSSNIRQINVAGLKSGVYILVVNKGKYRESTKIIIQ